jgi:hypothetical protein
LNNPLVDYIFESGVDITLGMGALDTFDEREQLCPVVILVRGG